MCTEIGNNNINQYNLCPMHFKICLDLILIANNVQPPAKKYEYKWDYEKRQFVLKEKHKS
jgi:hypothetical protein